MTIPIEIGSAKQRRNGAQERRSPKADDGRPRVQFTNANPHLANESAAACLAEDRDIYQRNAALVRVIRCAEVDSARDCVATGTPQIRNLSPAILSDRLSRLMVFQKFSKREGEWYDATPPSSVVVACSEYGEWPGVPPITGIIETPSMRPDGTIIDRPGYDAATGYLYEPSTKFPAIPSKPTRDDAGRALGALLEPWRDFPFRAEADRYVPIAALLTLVCRPAIRGACPAIVVDACVRGSGKTLITRCVTTLAHGREAALMSFPPESVELEKILASWAIQGANVAAFDNVATTFGGGPLDKVLTCSDRVELRVLGQSLVPSFPWRAVVFATGNNVVFGGDTTRRVLVCRLEPEVEMPEERTDFGIPDLAKWCRENHPRMVAAALTLVRAYVVAGRPKIDLPGWGSFEAWRDLIAASICWAGGADVTKTRPTLSGEDDSELAGLRTIIEMWPLLAPEGMSARAAIQTLYPPVDRHHGREPDRFDALREAIEVATKTKPGSAPLAVGLGNALRRFKGRVVAGQRLETPARLRERNGMHTWIVTKVGAP